MYGRKYALNLCAACDLPRSKIIEAHVSTGFTRWDPSEPLTPRHLPVVLIVDRAM